MSEAWRPVRGWQTRYEISNKGRIRSLPSPLRPRRHSGKILKPTRDHDGYLSILLSDGKLKCHTKVHRLMLIAFTGVDHKHLHAAHRNGNKIDNRLSNVCWTTQAQNNRDKMKHGRMVVGEKHHHAKLNATKVKAIRLALSRGETMSSQARKYGVSGPTIWAVKSKKTWRHLSDYDTESK